MQGQKAWSPVTRELLAVHEAFRRLGFLPHELFISFGKAPDEKPLLAFTLRTKNREYHIAIAREWPEDFQQEWAAAVEWWNGLKGLEESMEIYCNSRVYKNSHALVADLKMKGLVDDWNLSPQHQ